MQPANNEVQAIKTICFGGFLFRITEFLVIPESKDLLFNLLYSKLAKCFYFVQEPEEKRDPGHWPDPVILYFLGVNLSNPIFEIRIKNGLNRYHHPVYCNKYILVRRIPCRERAIGEIQSLAKNKKKVQ
jgi:hypothetical protein